MTNEPSDRTIILHLLRGAVPERADYLSNLWVEHGHSVEVAPSTKGATMNSTSRRIKFDTKTMAQFALAMHMVQPAGFLLLRRGRRVVWVALEALQDETI